MKKVNLLSKAEMKKVMGGEVPGGGGGGAFCSAKCEGKSDAVCHGTCTATDGVGCTGTDAEGNPTEVKCGDVKSIS
ncbi:hypothetical protein FA048_12605 [Pedobacter polaris]|uniref:Bacteriocin n=1 Tax=Pedobacter polaris TaxID=2571273 RepID=A0A4U1CLS6_9SPHI|nr:hypothetical protein [Pedobacter polaris]TKC07999.1 hypothetical protein FA048_12605 [Pedobacter polaris]